MSGSSISPSVIWTLPFFSDLKEKEKAELLRVASFKHVGRRKAVFFQGDELSHLYWICKGAVQLFRETPDGHELTESVRIVGDVLFDPDALQLKQTHTMNARAVQETTLLAIPAEWFSSNLEYFNNLASKFLLIMAQRVQEARIEAEHQATMNAVQIIACFLQHLCVLHRFDPNGFELPYSKSLIASLLGMELESLSRALPKLRALGITVNGKQVSFTNIETAQQYSCGSCSVTGECHVNKEMQKSAQRCSNARRLKPAG